MRPDGGERIRPPGQGGIAGLDTGRCLLRFLRHFLVACLADHFTGRRRRSMSNAADNAMAFLNMARQYQKAGSRLLESVAQEPKVGP